MRKAKRICLLLSEHKEREIFSIRFDSSDEKYLQIEMESSRLRIVSYSDRDFNDCLALYGDQTLTKYFDYGQPRTKEQVEELIKIKGYQYLRQGLPFGLFSLFDKNSMAFVGQVDLLPANCIGTVEVGFILRSDYQKQGLCTEAVSTLLQFVREINRQFENISIYKVIATAHPENHASKRVLEKVGMRYQGVLERFDSQRLLYSIDLI